MCKGQAPIYQLFCSEAPKAQQICHYNMQAKPSHFFYCTTQSSIFFYFRNNFVNLGFFAKVSIPVEFIIPWLNWRYIFAEEPK